MIVTTFPNLSASAATPRDITFEQLAERVSDPREYSIKADCPLIVMAAFGQRKTAKGSLRHAANILTVHGIEGDYDAGQMPIADAAERLRTSGVRAVLYTSPSHRPEAPRWRVLAPLSTAHPPDQRARFVARLNGVLGGVLAPESYVLGQSYYIGRVTGAPYEWTRTAGECIDLLDELDAIAVAAPKNGATRADRVNDIRATDPVAVRLQERGLVREARDDGTLVITCPFEEEHTTPGGAGATVYFPPHTRGHKQGNFKCMHGHCATRAQVEFRASIGMDAGERAGFHVFDDWWDSSAGKRPPGVWYLDRSQEGVPTQIRICSPLYIEAVTFDQQGNNFGRLLRFRNSLGHWREWAMPMDLLAGLGNEVRAELLAMGVEIAPSTKARNLLAQYLQEQPPEQHLLCALSVGWHGDSFVLPDTVIGPDADGVVYQSGERGHDEFTRGGTLEGWREAIAARAVGNPILIAALCAAFAGPLLDRCGGESGGLHLSGPSSVGKSVAAEVACSVWGGPTYKRSWRATANGMEGAAAMFNDCLLVLDELSECNPQDVAAIVYALGNGQGKQRADRYGRARSVIRWRCSIVSTGEKTPETRMEEAGIKMQAGQKVRLLDIPVTRRYGAWDDLHGASSGAAFSEVLRAAVKKHHGRAGRAYLERLTQDGRDLPAEFDHIKTLQPFSGDELDGQERRAGARFALLALAGELATRYGITGWPAGVATAAAADLFAIWRAERGQGPDERRQIVKAVATFIELHGDSRFSDADTGTAAEMMGFEARDPMRINRAGWWSGDGAEREYLFTAAGLREALKGFDFKRALDVLQEVGALPTPKSGGERRSQQRIGGRREFVYRISHARLHFDDGTVTVAALAAVPPVPAQNSRKLSADDDIEFVGDPEDTARMAEEYYGSDGWPPPDTADTTRAPTDAEVARARDRARQWRIEGYLDQWRDDGVYGHPGRTDQDANVLTSELYELLGETVLDAAGHTPDTILVAIDRGRNNPTETVANWSALAQRLSRCPAVKQWERTAEASLASF